MRPPRSLCLMTWTAVLLQSFGCYSYRQLSAPSPSILGEARVTTRSGEVIELAQVEIDSMVVRGNRSEKVRRTGELS